MDKTNQRIRETLKAKGLLFPTDTTTEVLNKLDLTTARKLDQRFYPPDAVVVFNQKVRDAEPGAKGRLGGILSALRWTASSSQSPTAT